MILSGTNSDKGTRGASPLSGGGGGGGGNLGSGGTDWYISPTGNNANSGLSSGAPKKTFANVFAAMASGDQLWLMDGTYSVAAGTGIISWVGTGSGQPPSGISIARSTRVKAVNAGGAIVAGDGTNGPGLFHGRSTRADNYIEYHGMKFTDGGVGTVGAGNLYNGNYCTFKNVAFDGTFGMGTPDHQMGVTFNLVEDCWCWATGARIIAINYQANKNIWRRFVVRGDGCGTSACSGSGNPNVGFTVYDSQDVSVLNVFVVDRVLASSPFQDYPYADFATAQHTPAQPTKELGRNRWLGCMSIKSADAALNFEGDVTIAGVTTWTINNFGAVCSGAATAGGVNVSAQGTLVLNGVTATNTGVTGDGVRVAPSSPGTSVINVLTRGFNRGLNSSLTPSYTSVYGATTAYNQTTPTVGVHTANQFADGTPQSLKYPTRIESGSALKGAGSSGDIGANVMYCYGEDGTRFDDATVNTLQTTRLWPYPNEARIKSDMSGAANGARGFCTGNSLDGSAQSLTKYIWESLGNQIPADYYA